MLGFAKKLVLLYRRNQRTLQVYINSYKVNNKLPVLNVKQFLHEVVYMKIGFIGFGEVASTISKALINEGIEIYTSLENRSIKTHKLASKIGVNLCKSYKEVAITSDILISAVVPAKSIQVAQEVGQYSKGIYVDMNNVSPITVKKALEHVKNHKTVDAAIMGGIRNKGINVMILASGNSAQQFAELNNYGMNIKVIGSEIGKASTLKMLRSSYTKGVSALLSESLYAAYKMDLDTEFIKCLENTECPGFKESALSRVITSGFHAERRAQEMNEVVELISDNVTPLMSNTTKDFFQNLAEKLGKLEKRPDNYRNLFKKL